MKTKAEELVNFTQQLEFKDLPKEVVERCKICFLDTLGICFAASQMKFSQIVVNVVKELGGKQESTLIGFEGKVPISSAVLANGTMAHGLDFDETHTEGIVHPSACVVPVALAAGEAKKIDGKTLITAAVAGLETLVRIGLTAPGKFHERGFHPTPICGTFATSLVVGRIFGLSSDQIRHALGINGSQATGLQEFLNDGTWVKQMHPGWAAHSGVMAVLLAEKGFTGPHKVFEGRFGLFNTLIGQGNFDIEKLTAGLGNNWETLKISIKKYPACHYTHAYLDCALYLKHKYNLDPKNIAKVECRVSKLTASIVCEPINIKRCPQTSYGAKFSLPYTVAVVLLEDKAGLDEFSEEKIKDPEVLELSKKINYVISPDCSPFSGRIKIEMKDGKIHERREEFPKGHFEDPLTKEEIKTKFKENIKKVLPEKRGEMIIDKINKLEELNNVSELMELCEI